MARKAAALAMLALVGAVGLLAGGAAPAAATQCPYADMRSAELTLAEFDYSTACLINEERAASGLQSLRPNPLLRRAAWNYTNALLRGRFFSHHGDFAGRQDASTPVRRLRAIGYVRPHYVWVVGEDLHWSTPEMSSPGQTVQAWMDSPIHRMYLLKPKFDELGVAGVP